MWLRFDPIPAPSSVMITVPAALSANLRTNQKGNRSGDGSDELRTFRYLFMMFLLIAGSIFLNSLNLFVKRPPNVSLTAVLALLADLAVIVCFPVHFTYPLIVTISAIAALAQMGQPLRPPVAATCVLLAGVVTLSLNPQSSYPPLLGITDLYQAGILQAVHFFLILATMVQSRKFFQLGNFFAGILIASSVAVIKVTWSSTSKELTLMGSLLCVSGLILVLLARRTVRVTLKNRFTAEYASWTLCVSAIVSYENFLITGLSLIVAVLLRYSVAAPVPVEKAATKQSAREAELTIHAAHVSTTLSRRKGPAISTPPTEEATTGEDLTVGPIELGDLPVPADTIPDASTASSSIVVTCSVDAPSLVTAPMYESDEDEIFRRIANNSS